MKFHFPASSLREIADSAEIRIRLETAIDCESGVCNSSVFDEDGNLEDLPPHFHLVVSGQEPESGPRWYTVGEGLPRSLD